MFILKRKVVRRLSESTSQIKTKLILAEQRTSVNNSERQMKRKNKQIYKIRDLSHSLA